MVVIVSPGLILEIGSYSPSPFASALDFGNLTTLADKPCPNLVKKHGGAIIPLYLVFLAKTSVFALLGSKSLMLFDL